MGYLCSDFLKSTVVCFLRPIVQFALTFVCDCTCPASSVASLATLGRAQGQLQRRCSCSVLGDEHSQPCLLLCTGERERDQPGFRALLFVELWNYTCCFQYCSFVPHDSFFCQVSHSDYGFISGSLINYPYSLHT